MPNDDAGFQAPEENPYLTQLNNEEAGHTARFKATTLMAADNNPDEIARQQRIAKILGSPPAAVQALPEEAARAAKVREVTTNAQDAPVLQKKYTDADFANIAMDDSGVLASIEQAAKWMVSAPGTERNLANGAEYVGKSLQSGLASAIGLVPKLLNDALPMFGTSESDLAVLYKNDPKGLADIMGSPATAGIQASRAMQQNSENVMAGMSPEAKAQYDLQYATTDASKSAFLSPIKMLGDALQSLPSSMVMAASMYVTKGASKQATADAIAAGLSPAAARAAGTLAAEQMMARTSAVGEGTVGYGQQAMQTREDADKVKDVELAKSPKYQRLIQEGYDPSVARTLVSADAAEQAGQIAGIVDGAVNLVGGKFLGRIIGEGGKPLQAGLRAAGTEGATEFVQSPGEQFGQNLAVQQNMNPDQDLSEGVLESAIQGLAVGGLMGGAMGGVNARGNAAIQAAQTAEDHATQLEQLQKTIEASKVLERNPDSMRSFAQDLADQGVPMVFVDSNALAQAGVKLDELAQVVPSVAAQMDQVASGGDFAIPTSELLVDTIGTTFAQPLIDHARTSEDAMSRAEAETHLKEHGDNMHAEIERVLTEKENDTEFKAGRDRVQAKVLEQLNEIKRFTPKVNEQYAALTANFYAVMAARSNMTVEEFAKKYELGFASKAGEGGLSLEQSDLGAKLADRIAKDPAGVAAEYAALPRTDGGRVLNTDEARELSEGYRADRTKSADVHDPASQFVKDLYAAKLAQPTPEGRLPLVLFTAGGTGAGKSTSLSSGEGKLAASKAEIIYDTNMNRLSSATQKVEQALAAGRKVIIQYTYRDPVESLTKGALPRAEKMGRTVPLSEHARTHVGASQVMRQLAAKYEGNPNVEIRAFDNSKGKDNGIVSTLDQLPEVSDNGLDESLYANLKAEHAAGRITDATYAGTAGLQPEGSRGPDQPGATGEPQPQHGSGTGQARLDQTSRGQINFGDDVTTQASVISLFKGADLSTFIHESGHFYLEVQADLAARISARLSQGEPVTPGEQSIVDDMNTTLAWLGVKGTPEMSAIGEWLAMPLEQKRPYHEQFARGFESYAFEGQAPSLELQSTFQTFRAWLVNVYRSVLKSINASKSDIGEALHVELSPEVRSVMDRMLATTDQITEAEAARTMGPLFESAEKAGMTAEEYAAYHGLATQATKDAIDELQGRGLRDMQWLQNARSRALKVIQKQHDALRAGITAEVRSEVMAQPIYRAWAYLTSRTSEVGPDGTEQRGKIRTDDLRAMYGTADDAVWRTLSALHMTSDEIGSHPDLVAEKFDFSSGDELVHKLAQAEPPKSVIERMTDQRMLEEHGDLATPAGIERAADQAIHNDARAKFLATELGALQKAMSVREKTPGKRNTVDALAQAAKEYASAIIAKLKVRDIRPAQYAAAEVRSAKAAAKSIGNVEQATLHKRNQLINMYATKAAYGAQDEVKAAVEYFRKFDTVSKTIDPEYQDQIHALLERFDLRASTSLKAIDKRASLVEWVASQVEQGIEPDIPPELLQEANRKSFKEMTVEEVRGLRDTIQQIEHIGRLKNQLLTSQANRQFGAAVDEIVASIDLHAGDRKVDTLTPNTLPAQALIKMKNFWAEHIKAATWARVLDGGKDGGPMWEYLIRTANHAGDTEVGMKEKATKELAALVAPVLKEGKMGGKGIFYPELERSLNKEARLAIALNMGNESNMQRLLGGSNWTLQQLQPVLNSLSASDWTFVQAIWDHFEQYRPMIAAKEKRVYGKEPEWIKAVPVQTAFGTLRGGYYPVKYDARASERAESHAEAESAKRQLQGAYTSATTRRSFTKARADQVKGRPLLMSLEGIYNGVNEVIHDLTWHEWLIDANKLVKNKKISSAIREKYGPEAHQQFKKWLEDNAEGGRGAEGAGEVAASWVRQGVSVAGLGFNVLNAAQQPLGLTQSIVRIGAKWVGKGMLKSIGSPIETNKEINEKSEFMRTRSLTRLREVAEIHNQVKGKSKAREAIDASAYFLMMRAQQLVDVPTWWGGYEKAIAEGNDEKRAVALADQGVIDSQGSGGIKDQAKIERGGPYLKLFTTFYSFFNTATNLGMGATMTSQNKAKLAADYLLLFTVPAILGAALKDALTAGDSGDWEDDKILKKLIGEQLQFLFGLMVGVREFGGAMLALTGTAQYKTDYQGPAGLRFIGDLVKLGVQVNQGDMDDGLRKAIVNTTGELLRLPSGAVNKMITGAEALHDGKTQNPGALLTGYQEPH
jgi:hypothetical protein